MIIKTVTTFNQKLYHEYAHRFIKTYNWPFELIIYSEDDLAGIKHKKTFELIPKCKEFIERNINRPNPKSGDERYLFDAVRFCYKVYVYTYELLCQIENKKTDSLICIDADSVFYNPINIDWIKKNIHRERCMMTYLGRPNYSECGFLYFNLRHPHTKSYALEMQKMYNQDLLYNEKEFHDSYIWDLVRKKFEIEKNTKNYDIGDDKIDHVQSRSVLGQIYDHTKGPKRKKKGRSDEFTGDQAQKA